MVCSCGRRARVYLEGATVEKKECIQDVGERDVISVDKLVGASGRGMA